MPWVLSFPLRVFVLILAFILTLLPRKIELIAGRILGRIIRFFGYRKKVVIENLKRCFPEQSDEEREKLKNRFYGNFGILILELCHHFSPIPGHYKKYVQKNTHCRGYEKYEKARARGKGVIYVSSHLGNWEMMAGCGALAGVLVTAVSKHLKPEWLHRQMESGRLSVGVRIAYEPRTLSTIMRALRANEAVAFMMDQYAGPPIGIPVKFFGVEVGTLAAVGTLVSRTDATVLPSLAYRDENGIIQVEFQEPLELGDTFKDIQKTTQIIAGRVEEWVRCHPDQWLWTHRRFKSII